MSKCLFCDKVHTSHNETLSIILSNKQKNMNIKIHPEIKDDNSGKTIRFCQRCLIDVLANYIGFVTNQHPGRVEEQQSNLIMPPPDRIIKPN